MAVRSVPESSGKEFRLSHKSVAGPEDGFLVDRRGDQRIQFAAQTAPGCLVGQPGQRSAGNSPPPVNREPNPGAKTLVERVMDEETTGLGCARNVRRQGELQAQFPIELLGRGGESPIKR